MERRRHVDQKSATAAPRRRRLRHVLFSGDIPGLGLGARPIRFQPIFGEFSKNRRYSRVTRDYQEK